MHTYDDVDKKPYSRFHSHYAQARAINAIDARNRDTLSSFRGTRRPSPNRKKGRSLTLTDFRGSLSHFFSPYQPPRTKLHPNSPRKKRFYRQPFLDKKSWWPNKRNEVESPDFIHPLIPDKAKGDPIFVPLQNFEETGKSFFFHFSEIAQGLYWPE